MSNKGFIQVHREHLRNGLTLEEIGAWVTLLDMATVRREPEELIIRGRKIMCGPNEILCSLDELATKLGFPNKMKIKRLLNKYQRLNMLCYESVTVSLRLKLLIPEGYNEGRYGMRNGFDTALNLNKSYNIEKSISGKIISPQLVKVPKDARYK